MSAAMTLFHSRLFLIIIIAALFGRSLGQSENKKVLWNKYYDWYKKYRRYPEYCSTPEQMKQRSIPPLTRTDERIGATRLMHVSVVIRHGARTPWHGGYQCWDGYWEDMDTGVWDCALTTMMAPPTPGYMTRAHRPRRSHRTLLDEQAEPSDEMPEPSDEMPEPPDETPEPPDEGPHPHHHKPGQHIFTLLFEKKYDGLENIVGFPTFENQLHGTCMTGQLILQGYQQEWTNGQFLRDAYVFHNDDDVDDVHDVRMRLLDSHAEPINPWEANNIYLRSDDEQRTLLSGQLVIQGMLHPELRDFADHNQARPAIPLHTADYSQDILSTNERACPRLAEIKQKVQQSTSYQDFLNSAVNQEVQDFIRNDLNGDPDNFDIFGCLMETVCTDRNLPTEFAYEKGNGIFEKMISVKSEIVNRVYAANNSEYAKLAMAPLWTQILRNVGEAEPLSKLAIYSGHDDTIAPLLASLGLWNVTEWPHFASMVLIEMHEFQGDDRDKSIYPSKTGFRLIYNGQIITSLMDKCPDDAEICDMSILIGLVREFTTGQSCERTDVQEQQLSNSQSDNGSSQQDLYHSIAMMLLGVVIGILGTIICLRRPFSKKQTQDFDGLPSVDISGDEDEVEFEDRFLENSVAAVIS